MQAAASACIQLPSFFYILFDSFGQELSVGRMFVFFLQNFSPLHIEMSQS
jgi:hypothetical protein